MKNYWILIPLSVFIFFLPFLIWPELLLGRSNDLLWFNQNFSFFKDQVLNFHHLPLWQNQILSGSPYLGDPQNPLLYLPNYLSLLLPLPAFMLVFFLLHYLIAAAGTFSLASRLGFSRPAALFSAIVYAFSPLFSAHLEAGHLNMLAAFAWFPLFIAGVYALTSTKPKVFQTFLLGISAAAMFLNYLTVFVYALPAALAVIILKRKLSPLFFVATGVFLLITLPQMLASLSYFPLTTRNLITAGDIFPQFLSFKRFVWSVINPYDFGLYKLGPETTLAAGTLPFIAALMGAISSRRTYKLLLFGYGLLALFLALNLKSPGYAWLVSVLPFILVFKIATRFWFITILLISLLGGYYLEKKLRVKLRLAFCALVFAELTAFGWFYFHAHPNTYVPDPDFIKLSEPVRAEAGYFRVYCVTGCLGNISLPDKGTADGYNPIHLSRYFEYLNRAAGYRFGSYSYSLPPYQTFPDKPQPDSKLMGILGVKYLFSPYPLSDQKLTLAASESGLLLYRNQNFLPRAFTVSGEAVRVVKDLPGEMTVSVSPGVFVVVINEPYMPLWQAADQNGRRLSVGEYNGVLLSVATKDVTAVSVSFAPWLKFPVGVSLIFSLLALGYLGYTFFKTNFRLPV